MTYPVWSNIKFRKSRIISENFWKNEDIVETENPVYSLKIEWNEAENAE